jgi:uncharacterized protein
MNKPILAVDFDDIVADFNRAFLAHHNEKYASTVSYNDITTFDLGVVYQIDRETFVERAEYFCHTEHDSIAPIDGAVDSLLHLRKTHDLHIVTSRWSSLEHITSQWLDTWLPNVFSAVHFVNQQHEQNNNKYETCHRVGATILIDDALHHIYDVAQQGITCVLLDRPWNQGELPPGSTRAFTWLEAVRLITEKN